MSRLKMLVVIPLLPILLIFVGCGDDDVTGPEQTVLSSRAYKGHANDQDMNYQVTSYANTLGTRLDDCQTCHKGGDVTSGGKTRTKNACDFCHYIPFPDAGATGAPTTYEGTLNPYGLAYKVAGRNLAAIAAIAGVDSDGDGYTNKTEIDDLRYPGSALSKPGQPKAPTRVLSMTELKAMTSHTQFLLSNSHKQQYDDYATYKGVKIRDLLQAVGVNLGSIDGITVIAPDGYMKDFDVDAIQNQYPDGLFYSGLGPASLGADCGFVTYPATLPSGLANGGTIQGEQWLLMAYERDGAAMNASYLDAASGTIEGEGPLRIIVPQSTPGSPDRGSTYSPTSCSDGWDYDDTKDHNAGLMVRGVIAIRINPLPDGYEAFDHMNGGWAYVDANQLVIFGQGVQ